MTAPQRIQLRRTKGWRKPPGVIVVARPTRWGNPYTVIAETTGGPWRVAARHKLTRTTSEATASMSILPGHEHALKLTAIADAVRLYRTSILRSADDEGITAAELLADLAGHDLACWCPLDQPCHADVLLELANGAPT